MTCKLCQLQPGYQYTIRPHANTCLYCNVDLGLDSFEAVYNGIVQLDGVWRHEFSPYKPYNCPNCGAKMDVSWMDCEDDGSVIDLAEAYQLVDCIGEMKDEAC